MAKKHYVYESTVGELAPLRGTPCGLPAPAEPDAKGGWQYIGQLYDGHRDRIVWFWKRLIRKD